MTADRQVATAWEAFVGGSSRVGGVRKLVQASWKRCRKRVDVLRDCAPSLSEDDLERRRAQCSALRKAAEPVLQQARGFLSKTGSMILLTDANGFVIDSAGDDRTIDMGRSINLYPGGLWRENEIGTNAIGTAIHEACPVQIHSDEHFCLEIKKWTCAASPIRHPFDGDVIGVLDISGPEETFHSHTLAFSVSAAKQIEAELARCLKEQHAELLQHAIKNRRLMTDDIALLDTAGRLIHATERVRGLVQSVMDTSGTYPRMTFFKDTPIESWASRLPDALTGASLEPVKADGTMLGALVILSGRGRPAPASRKVKGERSVSFSQIIGESPAMRRCIECAQRLSATDATVLIQGETGVGKELFARAIHFSSRRKGLFVPINAGALPQELIASEVFGYEKGSFTGALGTGRPGKVESADGGTLCLDEIGEMPLDIQPYLLRVLEEGAIYRLGSNEPRPVNIRLISMTNRDLRQEVEAGRFRSDLYYRLAVVRIDVPPLRERGDDAALLAEHFVRSVCEREGLEQARIDPEVLDLFVRYHWPGNVRELRNVVETMLLLRGGDRLTLDDVPPEVLAASQRAERKPQSASPSGLKQTEREAILDAIRACGGNLTRASERLGIARSTLYRKLDEYAIAR